MDFTLPAYSFFMTQLGCHKIKLLNEFLTVKAVTKYKFSKFWASYILKCLYVRDNTYWCMTIECNS